MDDFSKRIANLSPEVRALLAKELQKELRAHQAVGEPIAVIGMGCRFPGGANHPDAFWERLKRGYDAVSETPAGRWDAASFFDTDTTVPGKVNTRWGAYLDQVDQFDAAFFGIRPAEAVHMDPQQRILLEVAWEALEDAGQTQERITGSKTGTFVGLINHSSEYYWMQTSHAEEIDTYTCTGTSHSLMANRLAYQFDFKGPSLAVDTACSASLVAVHLAVSSLRQGECDMALAGGVHLMLTPENVVTLSKLNMMAPDGHCKTFDSRANGFVRGEGCGLVVLKRLSDAVDAGDTVLAVIRGTAVNQDGRSNGLTAPNGLAHRELIREALKNGGVDPSRITYVETHGTGTALGDPIEVEALTDVIGQPRKSGAVCFLGAVKSNIGHLEGAAGIAGLIKTVLALQHKWIPPNLHFRQLNPHISLENTPFVLPQKGTAWPAGSAPRCAGVSSFGVGGTNAHIVLEEADAAQKADSAARLSGVPAGHLLTLSARSSEALRSLAASYREFLAANEPVRADWLGEVCFSASARRSHHGYRLAVTGGSAAELSENLDAFLHGKASPVYATGRIAGDRPPRIAFVFSGQGPQWFGMGRELLKEEPVFRQTLERCDQALRQYASWSLLEELGAEESRSRLGQTEFAQPAIFAVQAGLAALLDSWGIVPDAVVGHSVGEVAAAYVAGALTFDDAVRVIFQRGRVMQQATGGGKMASLELPVADVENALAAYPGRLSIGAINAPNTTVISGETAALEEVLEKLRGQGVAVRMLPVEYAFHSAQMDPFKQELLASLSDVVPGTASIPMYSTVSGKLVEGTSVDAAYWWRNVRQTVQFAPAIDRMMEDGYGTLLEVSPHPVLSPAMAQCREHRSAAATILPTLRRGQKERPALLAAVGGLYACGCAPDWHRFFGSPGHFTKLPSYPWQRKSFWLPASSGKGAQPAPAAAPAVAVTPLIGDGLRQAPEAARAPAATLGEPSMVERILRGQLQVVAAQLEVLKVQGASVLQAAATPDAEDGGAAYRSSRSVVE